MDFADYSRLPRCLRMGERECRDLSDGQRDANRSRSVEWSRPRAGGSSVSTRADMYAICGMLHRAIVEDTILSDEGLE
jgi:hypothetical protein